MGLHDFVRIALTTENIVIEVGAAELVSVQVWPNPWRTYCGEPLLLTRHSSKGVGI